MEYILDINDTTSISSDTISDMDNIGWLISTLDTNINYTLREPATLKEVLTLATEQDRAEIIAAHKDMIEEATYPANKQNLEEELAEVAR